MSIIIDFYLAPNAINLFIVIDKLECLSVASIFYLVQYLQDKVEPTQVEHKFIRIHSTETLKD
jgi:hypothetical protein